MAMALSCRSPRHPGRLRAAAHPRQNDGNTLGCIPDDDIMVTSIFALKLTQDV